MLSIRTPQRGFTIIEVMITLAVIGVLLALGAPGFVEWLQNQQIRAASEATVNGLQVARGEAVRRNTPVRFQLVSDLSSTCVLSSDSPTTPVSVSWIVSLADPTGACDADTDSGQSPSPAGRILQKRTSAEGSPNARATSVFVPAAAPTQAASTVTFAALGNVIANADGTPSINRIDVTNVNVTGAMRPLRIIITSGGSTRMCDPSLAPPEPRGCPAFP